MQPHTIAGKSLGIFGILLSANSGKGNHAQKTNSALTAGEDACISISPEVFHSLIFCPGLATKLTAASTQSLPQVAAKLPLVLTSMD